MKRAGFINLISISIIFLFSTIFMVLAIRVNGVSYAEDLKVYELADFPQDLKLEIFIPNCEAKIARSGCCSWHGGVCDCILGRVVCCDGTLSPSCLCNRESNKSLADAKKHP